MFTNVLKGFSAEISVEFASLLVDENTEVVRCRRNGVVRARAATLTGGANASGKVPKSQHLIHSGVSTVLVAFMMARETHLDI